MTPENIFKQNLQEIEEIDGLINLTIKKLKFLEDYGFSVTGEGVFYDRIRIYKLYVANIEIRPCKPVIDEDNINFMLYTGDTDEYKEITMSQLMKILAVDYYEHERHKRVLDEL